MSANAPSDPQFLAALNKLKFAPKGKRLIYKDIAESLKFTPLGKSNQPLKAGGKAYNEAVRAEVLRRTTPARQIKPISDYVEPVKKTTIKRFDKFNNFSKFFIQTEGNNTVEDLYRSIIQIKQERDELGDDVYINLIFENNSNNKPRTVAVPSEILGAGDELGYQNFLTYLDDLDNGLLTRKLGKQTVGSDAMNYNEYKLLLNAFSITTMRIRANGSSEDMCFECVGIKSEDNFCALECLKLCGVKDFGGITGKDFRNFFKLTEFIKTHELPISIISNAFSFQPKFNKNQLIKQRPVSMYTQKIGNREYQTPKFEICEEDIEINYLFGTEEESDRHLLIYDEINQHIDYVGFSIRPKLLREIYLNVGGQVVKDGRVLFRPRQIQEVAKLSTPIGKKFVFFDYETVINYDENTCMSPYSLSILVLSSDGVDFLNKCDKNKDELAIAEIRETCCVTFLGYDCSDQFIRWIKKNQDDLTFTFVSYNGTCFDNFLLLDAILRHRENTVYDEMKVSNVFYNGSQLLNFVLNGRHETFDIHKHLMGSLKSNCESFKINCCSKKSFDHNKAQLLHKEGKLIDFITGNDELREYNEYDVLATAVLFAKYREALAKIDCTEEYAPKLHEIKTIGSLIWKVFGAHYKKLKIDFPLLEHQQYNDLQSSKIAGRVEMFNGVQKVEERLASTDVCSLYPYVMSVLNCYYPCGRLIPVEKYQGDDRLGFYYCDIDQRCLRGKNLPNIYAFKTGVENKWDYDGVIENYLISNVMIGLLREFGCEVTVRSGFVFSDQKKSCEMFSFLLDLMKEKNCQDTIKKSKDPKILALYNPALRETLKLLMNSLSGKVIEGLHTEKTIDFDSVETYIKIKEKAKSINVINVVGDKMFLTYEIDSSEVIKQQRPIFLGVLIYDYAKRYMYQNSYSKIGLRNLLYTDTDASKFRYRDFLTWKAWVDENNIQVPHWEEVEKIDERYKDHKIYQAKSKVFGSFEDELEDCTGNQYVFYCLEKKSWLYGWRQDKPTETGNTQVWHSKFRFKGINENAQMLTLDEPFLKTKEIHHATGNTEYKIVLDIDDEALHDFYNSNVHNSIGYGSDDTTAGRSIEFFESVLVNGHAYVLCQSFRKIVKNSAREVELENEEKFNSLMNRVQVRVMMKKITLNTAKR